MFFPRKIALLAVLSVLWSVSAIPAQTPADAELETFAAVRITDADVAYHMSPQERQAWETYRSKGKKFKEAADRFRRNEANGGSSKPRQAMENSRRRLVKDFRDEFRGFLGISGTTVVGFGQPMPTGREIAGEILVTRSKGWGDFMAGYWVRTYAGDLQWHGDDPRASRRTRQLGPQAGPIAQAKTRYREIDRPETDPLPAHLVTPTPVTTPVCPASSGPFGLTGCP